MKNWILISVVLALASTCMAQGGESPQSVVDAAKAARSKPVKAKKVLNDETLKSNRTGFPDASTTSDNAAEIVTAIRAFDEKHTPAETEAKVREWYDAQDGEMQRMINQSDGLLEPPRNCEYVPGKDQDYASCEREQQRRSMENRSKYNLLRRDVGRINQVIRSVRSQLLYTRNSNLNFRWMVEREFPYEY
jgi:hypothetical protein